MFPAVSLDRFPRQHVISSSLTSKFYLLIIHNALKRQEEEDHIGWKSVYRFLNPPGAASADRQESRGSAGLRSISQHSSQIHLGMV